MKSFVGLIDANTSFLGARNSILQCTHTLIIDFFRVEMNDVERCLIRFRQEIYYQCDLKSFAFSKLRIFFQFHPWRRMRDPVANISRKIRFSQEATVFSRLLCPDSWAVFNVGCAKGGFLTGGPGLNGKFALVNGLQMFSCVRLQWEVDSSRFLDSAWIDRDLSSVVSFHPSTRQGWTMPSHSPRVKVTYLLENFFPLILSISLLPCDIVLCSRHNGIFLVLNL